MAGLKGNTELKILCMRSEKGNVFETVERCDCRAARFFAIFFCFPFTVTWLGDAGWWL